MFNTASYNPDVLTCLANLSSDEVFTPPKLVNEILDLLPAELWQDKTATFLDPCSKSGVFLREITKRLMAGLEQEIPDRQTRINHILTKQVFGIAITELTAHLSRRSLYCSKLANGKYSVCDAFITEQGNLRFIRTDHTWMYGRCIYCGANQEIFQRGEELETHAYQFIHKALPEDFLEMKFDVIVGNPPYQLTTGGGQGATASPIYDKFVTKAIKLQPNYICMIIPARWYSGGLNLESFRKQIIHDRRFRELHDFTNASECFIGVDIKGGVCYFLWDRDYSGDCKVITHQDGKIISEQIRPLKEKNADIFIRYNEAVSILRKVQSFGEEPFENLISPRDPFGFSSNFSKFYDNPNKILNPVKIYYLGWQKKGIKYIERSEVKRRIDIIDKWSIIIPKAFGSGDIGYDKVKPIIKEPGSVCTETYLSVNPTTDKNGALNVKSYIETKFFHFMTGLKKNTQNAYRIVYSLVPIQDFSKPWSDEELYAKYGLSEDEIAFIESMIRPMDLTNGDEDA